MEPEPQSSSPYKVVVKGFPPYTQKQDLFRVFLNYGTVKVGKLNKSFAVLEFSNKDDVIDAVADSGKVNLYGEFLTVKRFTGKEKEKPISPKRECPRRKAKDEAIINPKDLDLSGDFYTQLDRILSAVRLTQEEVTTLNRLYDDVEMALQPTWPGCQAIPFGSITTGLGFKTSDADCFVQIPVQLQRPNDIYVNTAKQELHKYPHLFGHIFTTPKASTPVLKFVHKPTGTKCDTTFKSPLGTKNSKLITFLIHADHRILPMAVILKYWAKVHRLSGTTKLKNYTLVMLIVFYLQQPPLSILPSIAWLQKDPSDENIVDFWNAGFMDNYDSLPKSNNTSPIHELLGGFFQYYATFDFEQLVICPFVGYPIKKSLFKDVNLLPEEFKRYKENIENRVADPIKFVHWIYVLDPFKLNHNIASPISRGLYKVIKAYVNFAAAAYEKEKLNNCNGLLKIILLEKPEIPKQNISMDSALHPDFITNIIDHDWQSVVTANMLTVFEKICRIKLNENDPHPDSDDTNVKKSKIEIKLYAGVVTTDIWQRRKLSKLESLAHLDGLEKQARINDMIYDRNEPLYNIKFQLKISFKKTPRRTVFTLIFIDGNAVAFKKFVKFFREHMLNWLVSLLESHRQQTTSVKLANTLDRLNKIKI